MGALHFAELSHFDVDQLLVNALLLV